MYQTGEWEQQEHRHTEEHVELEDKVYILDQVGVYTQSGDALDPFRQGDHGAGIAVGGVFKRDHGGAQTECNGSQQPTDDEGVTLAANRTYAWLIQSTQEQHDGTDQTETAEDQARIDGDVLVNGIGDTDCQEPAVRGQHADQMAEEYRQDTHMKQVAGNTHVFVAEQLAGIGLPGVLFTIESEPASQQEDGTGQVGVGPKKEVVQCHLNLSSGCLGQMSTVFNDPKNPRIGALGLFQVFADHL